MHKEECMTKRELASHTTVSSTPSTTSSRILHRFAYDYAGQLLNTAGITINGSQPWDIRVHDERLYLRCLLHGSLGLGEAYMDGWWDCDAIDEFICRLLQIQAPVQVGWLVNLPLWIDSGGVTGNTVRVRSSSVNATTTSATISMLRCSTAA